MRKYGNRKTSYNGIVFDSMAEFKRYQELRLLEEAGEISDLKLQPMFELQPAFRDRSGKKHRAILYRADFLYVEKGRTVAEDVKGMATQQGQLRIKMLRYHYPDLDVRIIKV